MSPDSAKVLLVEDDRFLRRAAQAMLVKGGLTVSVATDGEEALAAARAGTPDLILLDLIMPKLQGFEVLRQLKEDPTTRGIPVIVLSNLGQESDIERAMAAGAVGYFVKSNLTLQELLARVHGALGEGRRR
jgi:two-component system phosphate regulon response regulator PhoB